MPSSARSATEGDNGFTLIELLVVVVIIGILIAIAIPLYLNYQKGAKDKSAQSDLRGAIAALEQCNSDNGTYPVGPVPPLSRGPRPRRSPTAPARRSIHRRHDVYYYTYTAAPLGLRSAGCHQRRR